MEAFSKVKDNISYTLAGRITLKIDKSYFFAIMLEKDPEQNGPQFRFPNFTKEKINNFKNEFFTQENKIKPTLHKDGVFRLFVNDRKVFDYILNNILKEKYMEVTKQT